MHTVTRTERWQAIRLTFFLLTNLLIVSGTAAADFYIASNGGDSNPGTQAKPFATMERARDAMRELIKAGPLNEPVTVRLQGGTYALSQEVQFGPEDSGTAACPITYTAAGTEPVVLDGGRRINGWKRHNEQLWVAKLPESPAFALGFQQIDMSQVGPRMKSGPQPEPAHAAQ